MNETQLIEWKASWRDEYLQWLCGFANAQGGVLEVGRDDAEQVVGLVNAARLMEELPNKLRDLLGIVADINLLQEAGCSYLRIAVEPYPVPIETTQKTTQKTTEERILDLLQDEPTASRQAIAKRLEGITENGVKYHLAKLKKAGKIRRVGPDRGGHWEVLQNGEEE